MNGVTRIAAVLALFLLARAAGAQTTTVTISGRVTDPQGGVLAAVTVQARNVDNGFTRSVETDQDGAYHLPGLPIGAYDLTAEADGFRSFVARQVVLNVGRDLTFDIRMQLSRVESVSVSAAAPLISTRSSAVGEVVDLERIENLPLNGRQFANLAAIVPGVGLSFHSDLTKSSQYAPQISGGNGRNINYVIDGGDNNDDTVGGLLQLFPLESIEEFNVLTQRFDAEYGRSNGAVISVVTKSGTNQHRGSWFTLLRDDSLNARTFREELSDTPKQSYARQQYGGSLGGPILVNRAHFFGAFERTQQDTKQIVSTLGIFPDDEGIFTVPFRQTLFTAKVTATLSPRQYLSVRYGRDHNTQPSGVTPSTARSAWATSTNSFDSFNVNHNYVLRPSVLNETVIQYADFVNDVPANTSGPSFFLPGGIRGGTSATAPQRTEQTKWQLRNDLSWTTGAGTGLSHDVRAGVNWIHEPRLQVYAGSLTQGLYTMLQPSMSGPVTEVMFIGGNATVNFPIDQYGFYVQDDWRLSNRVTLNLGVRWDDTRGFPIDQSGSANFLAMQEAGRAGLFAGTILDEFGHEPRADRDNIQPRLGAVVDLFGSGRDVVRGGWGIYTDFGYVASNALTAAFDSAQGGIVFLASNSAGLRKTDGSFFRVGDPLDTIRHLNVITGGSPPAGEVVSPLLEQPYSRQASVGWSHQINASTVFNADYVRVDGRDLNVRLRPNVLVSPGRRLLQDVNISPRNDRFRTAVSKASSRYDGLILSVRRRMSRGIDASASYTLARAITDVGTAYDEIVQNLIQDIGDPFGAVQQGPAARSDSRHMISVSGIIRAPWNVSVAPIFYYRSALPVHTFEGFDVNADGNVNDRTALAYRYTGLNEDTGEASFEEAGPCETVNCSRRAPFSQLNLRISRTFGVSRVRIEAIGEVFNLFNAINPFLATTQNRSSMSFMQPSAYSGDVGQPEQRVGQIGFRVTF